MSYWNFENGHVNDNAKGIVHEIKSPKTIGGITYDRVLIYTQVLLDKMLTEGGFEDTNVVLNALQDNGLLMTKDKKRLYSEFDINDERCKVYKILIPQVEQLCIDECGEEIDD